MGSSSPQSFEKRQRERRKALKRADKLERRLIRNEEKRRAKEDGTFQPTQVEEAWGMDDKEEETRDSGTEASPES